MAKVHVIRFGFVVFGLASLACEVDEPCMDNDPELVEKFGVPEHQTEGPDGLCYAVDPEVKNWGASCDSLELCGGGLICPGEELPICTAVGCNPDPKKDEVCGKGFTCIETGDVEVPTICVPVPPTPPPAAPTASSALDDAGAGDAAADADPSERRAQHWHPVRKCGGSRVRWWDILRSSVAPLLHGWRVCGGTAE
jgi:hypothetical protein